MSRLYIDKVGFEIEGGWNNRPKYFTHDGSVGGMALPIQGECVSPAYRRDSSIEKFLLENYPEAVNETCGFHIHTSFNNAATYSRLMEQDFLQETLRFWESFGVRHSVKPSHRFWKRLRGENRFCGLSVEPARQAAATGKDGCRYGYLNYCYSFHKTLELRILPAWRSKEFALISLMEWIKFEEDFLLSRRGTIGFGLQETLEAEYADPLVVEETIDCEQSPYPPLYSRLTPGTRIVANGRIDARSFNGIPGVVISFSPTGSGRGDECELYARYTPPHGEPFEWYGWGTDVDNSITVAE